MRDWEEVKEFYETNKENIKIAVELLMLRDWEEIKEFYKTNEEKIKIAVELLMLYLCMHFSSDFDIDEVHKLLNDLKK